MTFVLVIEVDFFFSYSLTIRHKSNNNTKKRVVIAKIKSNGDLVSQIKNSRKNFKQNNNLFFFLKSKYLGVFCIAEQYATVKTINIQCSSNEQFQPTKMKDFQLFLLLSTFNLSVKKKILHPTGKEKTTNVNSSFRCISSEGNSTFYNTRTHTHRHTNVYKYKINKH